MKYLRDTAIESNAPFIALTETHLKPDILDPEVKIEGWSLYRTDRGPGKSHGGVAIYLRKDLIGQLVTSHSNSMCETLAVKVKTLNLILICVYRPPNSTLEAFEEALEVCQKAINEVVDNDPKTKDVLILVISIFLLYHGPRARYIKRRSRGNQRKSSKQSNS